MTEAAAPGAARTPAAPDEPAEPGTGSEPGTGAGQASGAGPGDGADGDAGAGRGGIPAPSGEPLPQAAPAPALRPDSGGGPPGRALPGGAAEAFAARAVTPAAEGTPEAAFDALYAGHARSLTRQAFLLTGHRRVAGWAVNRAFHAAWERWPEVALDRDPGSWVRAAAHEYALAPWHRLWPGHRGPEAYPGLPEDAEVLAALLALPPAYRRTLLLHDGLGVSVARTAAETEASTRAAAGRVRRARRCLAERLPEVAAAPRDERGTVIGALLHRLAVAQPVRTPAAREVRVGSERLTRGWTGAAYGATALLAAVTAFAVATGESGDLLPTNLPTAVRQFAE
ncbi:sigma factor-like helix-turn-helix DNA-binding protein [Streptomyces sp. TRM 70351]|uniref:sigma factor-like helix-turn-helix DNA-binding protein n=1 Tax=Streptomyces sp. TRM 70351 TaxID=3116552 RepID=UPI002E7BC225|nr:sigma factor-like helix-turn-helix DNA-binding protein [Streptomyces sp. TRM 70351]MEE1927973.1 sigma factor-like helix-turn-helix DNA-binding protein [Streptomyces sp. TRM 70351]